MFDESTLTHTVPRVRTVRRCILYVGVGVGGNVAKYHAKSRVTARHETSMVPDTRGLDYRSTSDPFESAAAATLSP
jgi:hypothetical protein